MKCDRACLAANKPAANLAAAIGMGLRSCPCMTHQSAKKSLSFSRGEFLHLLLEHLFSLRQIRPHVTMVKSGILWKAYDYRIVVGIEPDQSYKSTPIARSLFGYLEHVASIAYRRRKGEKQRLRPVTIHSCEGPKGPILLTRRRRAAETEKPS